MHCEKRGLTTLNLNISRPIPNSYDAILLGDVLEHIDNETEFLSNLGTYLRPNGILVITVPAFNFLWSGEEAQVFS